MKLRYALVWLILAFTGWVHAATVNSVNTTNDLVLLNPNTVNTNYITVTDGTIGDGTSALWTYDLASVAAQDASHLKPLFYNGRWIKNLMAGGTNTSTLVASTNYNVVAGTNIIVDTVITSGTNVEFTISATNKFADLYVTNLYVTNLYTSNLFVTNLTVNSNTTFKGKVIFQTNVTIYGLLSVTNLTPNTVVKVDSNTNLASIANGSAGALTNDGSGNFGWFDLSGVVGTPYAVSNYFAAPGANMTITTNVVGTNVTWTFASTGGGAAYDVTNYFLAAGSTNITISTNVTGTNVTWTLDVGSGITGIITTNYTLDVGSNMILDETISGTNVTWTVRVNDPLVITNNIGAILSVGSTTYFDMNKASQTNAVSGSMAFLYATNGVDLLHRTHVRCLMNGSGSDQTLTFPVISSGANGWRTNAFSPVPPAITNNTVILVYLHCFGPTGTLAQQTNCLVSFEYY